MNVKISNVLGLVLILVFVKSENPMEELIDQVLSNDELFFSYFDCVMERGDCPPGGDLLRGLSRF